MVLVFLIIDFIKSAGYKFEFKYFLAIFKSISFVWIKFTALVFIPFLKKIESVESHRATSELQLPWCLPEAFQERSNRRRQIGIQGSTVARDEF
jgi:hypothetical protein